MTSNDLASLLDKLSRDATVMLDSEEATKQGIILPILSRLGWDRDNVREVIPEYRVGSGRVDYCLRISHKNTVFLEAKRTDQDLDLHQEQLLKYSFQEGVELAVLTNGVTWWLYLPLLSGSWEQRKFITIDITQQSPDAAATHFRQYLGKAQVESSGAVTSAKKLHQSRKKDRLTSRTLPTAWKQLCTEPDELLVELISEKVENLCGHKPTADQVAEFLERFSSGADPKPMPRPPIGSSSPAPSPSGGEGYTFSRPRTVTIFGEMASVSTWKEVLIKVCEVVARKEGSSFERVQGLKGRTRDYFSKDLRDMTSPEAIPGTEMYVETNLSANDIVKRCHQVLQLFGHNKSELNVDT